MEDLLKVGGIANTHGIKGEVKVFPTTDDSKRFLDLKEIKLDTGKEFIDLEIESVKFFKQFVILKFKGYDNINDIEKYKGRQLYVTRENAVELKEDEYFIAELIGLEIRDEEGESIARLEDVIQTGANDVYVIRMNGDDREVLLPAIKECILEVNVEGGYIRVHLMDGLL